MSEDFSYEAIAIKEEDIEKEQNEFGDSPILDDNNSQDFDTSQGFIDHIKKEILVLETKSISDFQATEICENNEYFFLNEEVDETENKIYQFKDIDIEDIPLSYLKKLLHSGRVENEAIETIDNKAEAASDTQSSNFCCNTCHQIFKIENDFENHMKIVHSTRKPTKKHKGEGRFKCKLCKNTYHSKTGLWHHKRLMHYGNKKKTKFMCTICDKRFFTRQNCRDHQLVHTKKKNYACSLCFKEFARQSSLRKHVRAHTSDGSYKCVNCKKVFKDREEFRTHCRNHIHEKNIFECKACGKIFANRRYLNKHAVLHKETKYKCTQCGKDCKYAFELRRHLMVHTGEKPFKCETCGKRCRLKSVYRKHLRTHMKISYPCPQCDKKYKTKKNLQLHIDEHNGKKIIIENKFECEVCNKKYTSKYKFKMHMQIHKGVKYKCDKCEKEFDNSYALRTHVSLHTGVKPFICETCGKSFRLKSNYKLHLSVHVVTRYPCERCGKKYKCKKRLLLHTNENSCEKRNTDNPLQCDICHKIFTQKSSLKVHMDAHKGIKHKCKECGKVFKYSGCRQKHMTLHTGEKPFECEICGKKFRLKMFYKKHISIHMNISYPCPKCDKKYKTKRYLELHINEHDGIIENQFQCNICNKNFKLKSGLNIHMDIHNGVQHICNQCGKQLKSRSTLRKHITTFHNVNKPFKCEICNTTFNTQLKCTRHLTICKYLHAPTGSTVKIVNEEQVDPELVGEIKVETTQEEVEQSYEAEGPVIYFYKTKDLEDNKYFELTDECIKGLSNNS